MAKEKSSRAAPRRKIPRSFKELTPAKHFNPRTFFQEMVLKAWFTPRHGRPRRPIFPKLKYGEVAITWIGHASFLIQFTDLNVLIDPNFANWLFLLKRIKRAGLRIRDLPPIDLVLLTHAHFDHFHKTHARAGCRIPRLVRDAARRRGPRQGPRLLARHRAGMVGEFLAGRLAGHLHAQQALGRADAS